MHQLLTRETVAQALEGDPKRRQKEAIIATIMLVCAGFCILVTVGIVIVLLETGLDFFTHEFFQDASLLERALRQTLSAQELSSVDLSALISSSVRVENATGEIVVNFERATKDLPGVDPAQLQAAYEQLQQSTPGLVKFWNTFFDALTRFFLDNRWTPLFGSKRFGIWPLINGTLMVATVAMILAVPLGLLTAIYLGMYASKSVSGLLRPVVEILAGIPTVVYGYFALLYITPIIQRLNPDAPIFNVLSAGIMMGIMIIPTVSSISLDAIKAVPRALQDGAYALGATKMEVVLKVVFPAAISGILASIILGVSRAVGETMIVTIAAGQQPVSYGQTFGSALAAIFNPVQSMATMTAFIAQVALGDAPAGSIQYVTLYVVGLTLFMMTLLMNLLSQYVSKRFREVYE
ncbi:MAG: phosphate ABC transporter permease subunit PstC [Cyanobacteriota bacterium]|nr:phosphate ABC transporter permease subunit PstC [Cyanobacteriota bacterium]